MNEQSPPAADQGLACLVMLLRFHGVGADPCNSYAVELFETIFNLDLNGDGTTGIPTAPVQSVGIVSVGGNEVISDGGSNPTLKQGNAVVTVGEFAGWSPTYEVKTATGYMIEWVNAGAGLYTI